MGKELRGRGTGESRPRHVGKGSRGSVQRGEEEGSTKKKWWIMGFNCSVKQGVNEGVERGT